jgi:hypothetical protein
MPRRTAAEVEWHRAGAATDTTVEGDDAWDTADRYLSRDDGSPGLLAYVPQMVRQPDGRCSDYATARGGCAPTGEALINGKWESPGPAHRGTP